MSDTVGMIVGGLDIQALAGLESELLRRREEHREGQRYHLADALLQQSIALRPFWNGSVPVQSARTARFIQLLSEARVVDARYAVTGNHVWLPYGNVYRKLVTDALLRELVERGYEEYVFPCLLDVEEFGRLSRGVFPFDKKVFRVSGGGREYILKPTGEAAIYPMFRQWLQDGTKLPLRVCQVGPYFRPRSAPAPYLSAPESSVLVEAHSAHSRAAEMESEFGQALEICRAWLGGLRVAPLELVRPPWTNHPVSEETVGFDVPMPWGKTLQTAVAYRQGQIFSKALGVQFRHAGTWEYTYQTTFGISERSLLTTLLLHADVLGLRMPPAFAPFQVIIMIVATAGTKARVMSLADRLSHGYQQLGIRAFVEETPLERNAFLRWTVRGAPLQVIVDDEALVSGRVEVIARSTMSRTFVAVEDLPRDSLSMLERVGAQLLQEQHDWVSRIVQPGVVEASGSPAAPVSTWACYQETCVRSLEANREGEVLGFNLHASHGPCAVCGQAQAPAVIFARRL